MTSLLVSVRSPAEALAALAGGAEIIDIKEPAHGSLGRASESVWREVCDAVKNAVPVSIALGELRELRREELSLPPGIKFAKVGLAGLRNADWRADWLLWRDSLLVGVQAIAVGYADAANASSPEPEEILEFAIANRLPTMLIDTFNKSAGTLLDLLPLPRLRTFCRNAEENNIGIALAGSLKLEDLAHLLPLRPAIIAVRTAACAGGRNGSVDVSRVRQLHQALVGSLPGKYESAASDKKTISKVQANG